MTMEDAIVPATEEVAPASPEAQASQQGQQEKPSALQLVMKVCSILYARIKLVRVLVQQRCPQKLPFCAAAAAAAVVVWW